MNKTIINKPNWQDYFINIVDVVATRSSCDRGKVGCVIVRNNRILSTGYSGAPSKFKECDEVGHLLREVKYDNDEVKQHCVRTIHAEQNAIIYAARYGIAIEDSLLYCTIVPCYNCAMMIVASGIKEVIAKYKYQASDQTEDIFNQVNVKLKIINNEYCY